MNRKGLHVDTDSASFKFSSSEIPFLRELTEMEAPSKKALSRHQEGFSIRGQLSSSSTDLTVNAKLEP